MSHGRVFRLLLTAGLYLAKHAYKKTFGRQRVTVRGIVQPGRNVPESPLVFPDPIAQSPPRKYL